MKLLVTGSEGYIGARLVAMAKARGHSITRLDLGLFRGCEVDRDFDQSHVIWGDFRDLTAADFAGVDAVIHLAALSNDPLSAIDPSLTQMINEDATVSLAQKARAAGVPRFVFSSTCSVYGYQETGPVDEGAHCNPLTAYGRTKLAAETALAGLARPDFTIYAMRHGTAYGASPMLRLDLVVNNLMASARLGGRIVLQSTGNAWRPMVHIDDIAGSMIAAAEAPAPKPVPNSPPEAGTNLPADPPHFARINVGRDADNVTILDLAQRISAALAGTELVFADGAADDKRSYQVGFAKLGRDLPDFTPAWTLDAGIAQMKQAILALPEDVLQREFSGRIARLKQHLDSGSFDTNLRRVAHAG